MNYTIIYYNERVREQVLELPAGILANYIQLLKRMEQHGKTLKMPHSRAMGNGLFELYSQKGKKGLDAYFTVHKLTNKLLSYIVLSRRQIIHPLLIYSLHKND
jgi:phage-related protein